MGSQLQVSTADGRGLAVEVAGPAEGDVVIYQTGTPVAGPLLAPLVEAGAERGLRHVGYDRPGYGDSDRHPGRRVADCVTDITAIADALDVERFYTVGHSGGGPHALACAAQLVDRLHSAATIAAVAPFDAEGLDWLAGMGQENHDEFAAVRAGPDELRAYLESSAQHLRSVTGEQVMEALGDLVSEADRAVVGEEHAERIAAELREAVRNGIWGWFDDDEAFVASWGFDLDAIEAPVTIWQGKDDRFVPFAHGEWLAAHVSGAKARLLPGVGHISLEIGAYGDVLDDLIASRA